ncbi:LysM peptidoglycan-binding domain-containing protein [Oceanispirochaeta crateris]|uniref:LysM peptidoglycan-binding domain-containing protein n=1 Tax=Oceanispirochaeta crateris TaxID=2518645 RepID=A0A5C1QMN9_9SPIO|nr:LysM peptidoglycan-binding domain-containing protein [Oceanispirochaeta crateris]QEN07826.1 LysM peptidoglycan-binding domain-containing protein [Oceanispirochaeta crateris]
MRTLGRTNESHRIFHLGPECYILYLGSDRDDDDPFLRIGNTSDLPEVLHKITSRIILTSSYTGNPFLEVEYARHNKLSYLGDVDVIEHFRKFFHGLNLPARELNDYRQVKTRENRHNLYFYNNGNIHLNFDNTLLFDLHKREKEDLHINQRCDSIKALLLKNPLRYTREELNKSGFFISENGNFYLMHKNWISLDMENQYFASLASQGIDPDEVNSVFTHIPEENMNYSEREALVQIIKRRALRNKDIIVLTTRKDITDHLLHLFPEGSKASTVQPFLMEPGETLNRGTMTAEVKEGTLLIQFGDKNNLIVPFDSTGSGIPRWAGWHVSQDRKVLTHRTEDGNETAIKTLQGIPFILEDTIPQGATLISKYLTFLHPYLESWEGRDSWKSLYDLEDSVKSFFDGADSESIPSIPNDVTVMTPGLEYLFLHNVKTLITQKSKVLAQHIITKLEEILSSMSEPSPMLPVLGDLYSGKEGPFVLYRISSSKLNPYNFKKAQEICKQMKKIQTPEQDVYISEKKRLQALLENLYGAGPAVTARVAVPPVKKSSTTSEQSAASPESKPAEERPNRGFDQKPAPKNHSKKRPRRSFLWILLLLLLLAGAVAAFFLLPIGSFSERGKNPSGASDASVQSNIGTGNLENEGELPGKTGSQSQSDGGQNAENNDSLSQENSLNAEATAPINNEAGTSGEGTAGEGTAGEGTAGEGTAGEGTAGEGTAGEGTAGEGTAGETGAATVKSTEADVIDEPIVETERRPQTREEALAYLEIENITITLVDIHLVSNDIAVKNGYRDLDYKVFEGNNPNWIYTGNVLEMPDGTEYTVQRGDSIWFIASRMIRRELETDLLRLAELETRFNEPGIDEAEMTSIQEELESMALRTKSEQLRERITNQLNSGL